MPGNLEALPLSGFLFTLARLNSSQNLLLLCQKSKKHQKDVKLRVLRVTLLKQPLAFSHPKGHVYIQQCFCEAGSHRDKQCWVLSCDFLKEVAFLRHDNSVNGRSLKSLSLLLINQPSLAMSLVTTESHDHFTGTWHTMLWGGSFSIKLSLYFLCDCRYCCCLMTVHYLISRKWK